MSTTPRDGVHPRGLAALSALLVAAVVVLCGLSVASAPADTADPAGSSSASVAVMPEMSGMSGMDAGEDCPVACAEDLAPACAVLVAVLGLGLLGLLLAGRRDTFLARVPRQADETDRADRRTRWPRGAPDLAELCVLRV